MKKLCLLIAVPSLLLLSACSGSSPSGTSDSKDSAHEPIIIQTTLYPLQYFAERIGGKSVKVDSLLPAGSDAHTFDITSKDMVEIANSDLFIYNGLGMEPYAEKISESLEGEDTVMLEASTGIDVISSDHHEESDHTDEHDESSSEDHGEEEGHDQEEEHHHGDLDPHVWLDPERAVKLAGNIRDALVELRPEMKDTFNQQYEGLKQDLETLDEDFKAVVKNSEHPEILVSHAAYGYWEDKYGIEQLPIAGLSPTEEPSQKELKELIETARDHEIHYVIFEQNVTTKIAEIIQKEINAKPLKMHNLSVLTEEDIANEENYLTIMEKNMETLKQAIQ
ncbi:zinc ABC transporter substrate-binding protein [Rossellomorea sp. AcN35-11]|nr:zinc ABC transporter substrate-binding protein [Rossellomorea aquimaris]WJV29807.1 zinc ABC transporter substrate-binding protein [Rossellomorea sp. AcN35-11]